MPKFIELNFWTHSGLPRKKLINIDLVRSVEDTVIDGKNAALLHYTSNYDDGIPVYHTSKQIMEMINDRPNR